jgi:hypothetical protein
MAELPPDQAAGHGTLANFHAGCRCPWCVSRAWERRCICGPCIELRAISPYVELPGGLPAASGAVR